MEKNTKRNNFDMIIKGTHLFLRYSVKGLFVLTTMVFILFFVVVFIPKTSFNYDLANLENINVNFMNIIYTIDDSLISGIINVKSTLILLSLLILVNLSFIIYLLVFLRNIVKDVKENIPFNINNTKRLKFIGYGYLVSSLLLPVCSNIFFNHLLAQISITGAFTYLSLNFQALFMGVIILILATVFEYGTHLQEDYDLTV